jgi:hypothetical protein
MTGSRSGGVEMRRAVPYEGDEIGVRGFMVRRKLDPRARTGTGRGNEYQKGSQHLQLFAVGRPISSLYCSSSRSRTKSRGNEGGVNGFKLFSRDMRSLHIRHLVFLISNRLSTQLCARCGVAEKYKRIFISISRTCYQRTRQTNT